jgi:3-oxoacyl-[acyl-carrier protein] reductase
MTGSSAEVGRTSSNFNRKFMTLFASNIQIGLGLTGIVLRASRTNLVLQSSLACLRKAIRARRIVCLICQDINRKKTKCCETNTKKLNGKVAIVTGASKGIGAAIARHLASERAAVVVNYASSKERADRVVDKITKQGGKVIAARANMEKKGEIERLFSETKKAFGRLDILVNNAGVHEFLPLEKITEEHFHRHFDINVLGLFLAIQEATEYFGPEGGSVINISSSASSSAPAVASVYSATKAAVDTITKSLAKELGPRKIRVNAINPGMVATEGQRAGGLLGSDFQKSRSTLGRIGQPDDIAPAVVFLASPDADWITGETLVISGGYS